MTDPREPVLISACLLGRNCRYNAIRRENRELVSDEGVRWVPVCPEEAGGLPTPRPAAEIEGDAEGGDVLDGKARVLDVDGNNVSAEFVAGAHAALEAARATGAQRAVLKSRSPSCGCGELSTAGGTRPGRGVTAALLERSGVTVESADFDPGPSPE